MKPITTLSSITCAMMLLFLLAVGCTSEELPPPNPDACVTLGLDMVTYDVEVAPIIALKCSNIGCHGSGSFNGDFTSYQGLLPDLDNGRVNEEVLIDGTMPLAGSESLTDGERNIIECWLGNGYPEN